MDRQTLRFSLLAAACAAIACLIFLPGLHGGFVFDDAPNIVNNPAIQLKTLDIDAIRDVAFSQQPGGMTRVLPTVSFALDYWRANGADAPTFKATNLFIHAITTLVLAFFLRRLLSAARWPEKQARTGTLLIALAWAIHPLQISSVLYAVQRMQTMNTLFTIAALYAYLSGRRRQIEGQSGRRSFLVAILLWILAFGSKEDAALLPAYTLCLELTLLGFRARDEALSRRLRFSYLAASLLAVAMFLLVVAPHYWSVGHYPGRDFSSLERLLTQGRVLCMYLGQILAPLPSHLPFYYDWIQPSRNLITPWSTGPALLLIAILLISAWKVRSRYPLTTFGILFFFAGHLITSNVIGLELAFEHRNQLPMLGVILTVADLARLGLAKAKRWARATVYAGILLLLAGAAIAHARDWATPLSLARSSTEHAKTSARAWNSLCLYYYELGGGPTPKNPYLDKAIEICQQGALAAPYSVTSLSNLIIFKSRKGLPTQADWKTLLNRLQYVNMGPENVQTASALMYNLENGTPLDEENTIEALDIISRRARFGPNELASVGNFILTQTRHPDAALPYYEKSLRLRGNDDQAAQLLLKQIEDTGHENLASKLRLERTRTLQRKPNTPQ